MHWYRNDEKIRGIPNWFFFFFFKMVMFVMLDTMSRYMLFDCTIQPPSQTPTMLFMKNVITNDAGTT